MSIVEISPLHQLRDTAHPNFENQFFSEQVDALFRSLQLNGLAAPAPEGFWNQARVLHWVGRTLVIECGAPEELHKVSARFGRERAYGTRCQGFPRWCGPDLTKGLAQPIWCSRGAQKTPLTGQD